MISIQSLFSLINFFKICSFHLVQFCYYFPPECKLSLAPKKKHDTQLKKIFCAQKHHRRTAHSAQIPELASIQPSSILLKLVTIELWLRLRMNFRRSAVCQKAILKINPFMTIQVFFQGFCFVLFTCTFKEEVVFIFRFHFFF